MDSDDVFVIVGIFLGLFMFIGLIGGVMYWVDKNSCLTAYENYHPEYSFWGGCRVMWNGVLTPTDVVRNITD